MTLNDIHWSFNDKFYHDLKEFSQDVSNYQVNIDGSNESWNPHEIVIKAPKIQIQYMAWVTEPENLHENERLIENDIDVFDEEPDEDEDGMYQVEIIATFDAENGKNFSTSEFLMKAHNTQVNKELGHHVFFEGTDDKPTLIDGLPTYYIACGS